MLFRVALAHFDGTIAGLDDPLESALAGAGLDYADVRAAVAAHTGLNAGAQNAVLGILHGDISAKSLAPLIATGLAATGVGAPVVAVVAAAIPIVEGLVHALTGEETPPDWIVGGVQFRGARPYGPDDSAWTRFDDFVALPRSLNMFGSGGGRAVDGAFPYYHLIESDLASMPSSPINDFRRAYYAAWKVNAERAINGHPYAPDGALLQAVFAAWQATHGSAKTERISASGGDFVSQLLAGKIDRQRRPDLVVNVAPIVSASSGRAGGALSVLEINQPRMVGRLSRLGLKDLAARDAMAAGAGAPRASSGITTAEKVVLGGGLLTVAGLAFAFWKGWIG